MAADKHICDPQQRALRLLSILAGNEVTGLTNADVAKQLGCSPPIAVRDLANLQAAGFAERVPETERWRLAPQIVQIALKHMAAMERAASRLAETRNRYSREG